VANQASPGLRLGPVVQSWRPPDPRLTQDACLTGVAGFS